MFKKLDSKIIKSGTAKLFLCLLLFMFIFYASDVTDGAKEGLALCFEAVIPALFPFFVLTNLFISFSLHQYVNRLLSPLFKLFNIPMQAITPFLLSILGGYPVGPRMVAELYKNKCLSKREASVSLAFCNNSGPAFLIGAVGGAIFESEQVGIILYLSHLFSALLCAIIFSNLSRLKAPKKNTAQAAPLDVLAISPISAFIEAVSSALTSILNVCAFVIFFSALLFVSNHLGIFSFLANLICLIPFLNDSDTVKAFIIGLFEMTNGVYRLSQVSSAHTLPLISAAVAFGGLSVHFQTLYFLKNSGLSYKFYFFGKISHAFLSFFVTKIMLFFSPAVSVFLPAFKIPSAYLSAWGITMITCLAIILIFILSPLVCFFQKKRL